MEINISTTQGRVPVTVLRVIGDLDYNNAEQFNATVLKVVENGARDILLDLSQVQFMSSIGIRSLAMLYDLLHPGTEEEKKEIHARQRTGEYKAPHLKLLNPQSRVLKTLQFVCLDDYLEIFSDEKQAIAAF